MTNPEDPSQQPPAQPASPAPPEQGAGSYPPPQDGPPSYPPPGPPTYPPPQSGPQSYPPQGPPTYPPPQSGPPSYPPPGASSYPPPQSGPPSYPPPPAGAPTYGYGQPGAGAPPGMFFDPDSGLMLPAGTQLASIGRRIGAYFLAILLFIVTLGIGYLIWGLIAWSHGQGPAMQVLGLRAWRPESGRPASWGYMALRDIVGRIIEGLFFGIVGLVSFIMMLTGKQRKTIHDMVGGTVVLYDPNKVITG
jgi:uncharacterized RDD family membrane protein YckC